MLAEYLMKQVTAELDEWHLADAKKDSRLEQLIHMSIEVLSSFRQRVSSWLQEGSRDTSLLAALGPPPEAVAVHSTSEDSQDSLLISPSAEELCDSGNPARAVAASAGVVRNHGELLATEGHGLPSRDKAVIDAASPSSPTHCNPFGNHVWPGAAG
ncbi:unnamed protein product [Symbiodinium pilosum]|uniref:Uncharacterized protein n=1 Tax=Symbiodinium pilosum TaxID=2952 RepID=A0A812SEQ3_SYMPI|nr:unnamed protein product [Symbiodinium pilosum]